MARTSLTIKGLRNGVFDQTKLEALYAKLVEHDTALDAVDTGRGGVQKKTVTVAETSLTGTSQAVNIGTALPTNAVVLGHEIKVNTQGVLAGNDLTITIGGTTANEIVASTDLDALAAGTYLGTLGARYKGSFSGQQLKATFAASDLASLSAGNWTINVWYTVDA